jgi:hypothetical protein
MKPVQLVFQTIEDHATQRTQLQFLTAAELFDGGVERLRQAALENVDAFWELLRNESVSVDKISISTYFSAGAVRGLCDRGLRAVIDVKEQQREVWIRQALIELGWTPPSEHEVAGG